MGLEYKPTNKKPQKKTFKNFYDLSTEEKLKITTSANYKPKRHSFKGYDYRKKYSRTKVTKLSKKKQEERDKWVKLAKKNKVWHVYVLSLAGDNYYVGITGNVARRYEQHSKGKGSKWTAKHKPVRIVEQRCLGRMKMDEASIVENEVFEEYFLMYGYRVRGGGKCRVNANW